MFKDNLKGRSFAFLEGVIQKGSSPGKQKTFFYARALLAALPVAVEKYDTKEARPDDMDRTAEALLLTANRAKRPMGVLPEPLNRAFALPR